MSILLIIDNLKCVLFFQKGQLARESSDSDSGASASIVSSTWHSVPGFVTKVGPKQGKRASWIGASGDQTFFKLDESLINEKQFQNSTVIASNSYFGECKLNYFF